MAYIGHGMAAATMTMMRFGRVVGPAIDHTRTYSYVNVSTNVVQARERFRHFFVWAASLSGFHFILGSIFFTHVACAVAVLLQHY